MIPPFSPQGLIAIEVIDQLRKHAARAEASGRLTDEQLAVVAKQNWFRMFLPRSMGGLECSLIEGLLLEEALAWIDGSLGWTITLCSGATMFAGYMEPAVAGELLADPAACFGGSGAPTGTASLTDRGMYRVSGGWRYATGAPHLTAFTANCRIEEKGKQVLNGSGDQLIRSFFFLPHEVSIKEDWHTMGLKATAGHSFEVEDLVVPTSRIFMIDPAAARAEYPVLHYPFLPFAEATLAVNTLGMTLRFLELCGELFARRGSEKHYSPDIVMMLDSMLSKARNEINALREHFYGSVGRSWESLAQDGTARPEELSDVGLASRNIVKVCWSLTLELYPYCGMAAANPGTELNRIWRDLFTASQHTLLTYPAA